MDAASTAGGVSIGTQFAGVGSVIHSRLSGTGISSHTVSYSAVISRQFSGKGASSSLYCALSSSVIGSESVTASVGVKSAAWFAANDLSLAVISLHV